MSTEHLDMLGQCLSEQDSILTPSKKPRGRYKQPHFTEKEFKLFQKGGYPTAAPLGSGAKPVPVC